MALGFNPQNTTQATPTLRSVILSQALRCFSSYPYHASKIMADLESVTNAVESAYILTAKADLPKVTALPAGYFSVEGGPTLRPQGDQTAEYARKRANAWLAVAKRLEAKEASRVYEEAKAKAVADAAAAAKQARLDELADEWFGKDYTDLGPNKAAAIKEIHRLETQLNTKDAA